MKRIKKIKCFIKNDKKAKVIAKKVIDILEENHFEIVDDNYDLGIAIGGDGTFLHMIRDASFNSNRLYVGIHAGTLGFAQEIHLKEMEQFIECLKKQEYKYEKIGVGEVEIMEDASSTHAYFLNEITIREKELNTLQAKVFIDNCLLENYVGDGLLVSTSFGSTAYNLSFGGSVVYNDLHTLQITPIAPINNEKYRTLTNSLIIPSEKVITIIPNSQAEDFILTIDGENRICHISQINITIHHKVIKVIRKKEYNFIEKVNDKFLKK